MKLLHASAAALCLTSTCLAGFDPKNMDTTVKPQADFYDYADGGWMKTSTIPADRSSWGAFDELQENNLRILHGILDKAAAAKNPGFIEKLVGDFYASGMDLATADAMGITPLKPELDRIAAIQSKMPPWTLPRPSPLFCIVSERRRGLPTRN